MDKKRISAYLLSLEKEPDPFLGELRQTAARENVPILRRETESFLRTLCAGKRPEKVLEIGTAIAYSALVMAQYSGTITTIENYPKRICAAKENIRKAGKEGQIRLLEGDAGEILKQLVTAGESYDLIFLDAAKGQYPVWLEDLCRLLAVKGILVADNVLQEETVLESRYTVDRRERTTHQRMREFLYQIKHDVMLESSVLPVGDGVSVSVRLF